MLKKRSKIEFFDENDEVQKINNIIDMSNTYHDLKISIHKKKKEIKKLKKKINEYYNNGINKILLLIVTSITASLLLFSGLIYVDNIFNKNIYSQLDSKKDDLMIEKLRINMSEDEKSTLKDNITEISEELNINVSDIEHYVSNEKISLHYINNSRKLNWMLLVIMFLNTFLMYIRNFQNRKDWEIKIKENEKNISILTTNMKMMSDSYNNILKPYINKKINEPIQVKSYLKNIYLNKKGNNYNSLKNIIVTEVLLSEKIQGEFYTNIYQNIYLDKINIDVLNSEIAKKIENC